MEPDVPVPDEERYFWNRKSWTLADDEWEDEEDEDDEPPLTPLQEQDQVADYYVSVGKLLTAAEAYLSVRLNMIRSDIAFNDRNPHQHIDRPTVMAGAIREFAASLRTIADKADADLDALTRELTESPEKA